MKTSYFAKSGKLPYAICIYVKPPKWFPNILKYPKLAPPLDLVLKIKNKQCTKQEYIERYTNEVLNRLNPYVVYNELINLVDDPILCCYEKSNRFCHRQLVAEWLNKYGYNVRELSKEK